MMTNLEPLVDYSGSQSTNKIKSISGVQDILALTFLPAEVSEYLTIPYKSYK